MEFLSTSMMVSLVVLFLFLFVLSLQEAQEVVDKDTISSNDEENGRRTRSVLNSGDCDSGEVSNGDEEECSSCGESDLVHMDSRVVRQLQPEEETSFGVLVGVLFLVLCLVDFLGGEIVFGVFEGEILRSLVK